MMAGVSEICRFMGIPCQVSVESVMACGMGACLGCSRPARNGVYTHVCVNGPVYDAEELVWKI
jgi:dihydroorotate dehydrogenase electron transfer subunit